MTKILKSLKYLNSGKTNADHTVTAKKVETIVKNCNTGGIVLSCLPFSESLNIYIYPLDIISKSIASEVVTYTWSNKSLLTFGPILNL
jgi:hypothetical protein